MLGDQHIIALRRAYCRLHCSHTASGGGHTPLAPPTPQGKIVIANAPATSGMPGQAPLTLHNAHLAPWRRGPMQACSVKQEPGGAAVQRHAAALLASLNA